MPTQEQIEQMKSKRQLKTEAREAARDKANAEARELATKSETQAKAKSEGSFTPPAPRKPLLTKEQQRAAAKARAQAQADRDAAMVPQPVKVDLSQYQNGEPVPLHVLNAMAQQADAEERAEANKMAQVIGKTAYDVALGKRSRHGQVSRFRKMHQTEDRAAELARQREKDAQ